MRRSVGLAVAVVAVLGALFAAGGGWSYAVLASPSSVPTAGW